MLAVVSYHGRTRKGSMTKREAAIVGAFTGVLLGKFSDMKEYIEEVVGRPVFTHELGGSINEEVKEKSKQDFLNIEVKG